MRSVVSWVETCPHCGRDVESAGHSVEYVEFHEPVEPGQLEGSRRPLVENPTMAATREEYVEVFPCGHHLAYHELERLAEYRRQLDVIDDQRPATVADARQHEQRREDVGRSIEQLRSAMAPLTVRYGEEALIP